MKKIHVILLFTFGIIINFSSFGQESSVIDSLEKLLENQKGLDRCKTLNKLADYYYSSSASKYNECVNEAIKLSKEIGDKKEEVKALRSKIRAYINIQDSTKRDGLKYGDEALRLAQEINYKEFLPEIYTSYSELLFRLGNDYTEKGIEYAKLGLKYAQQYNKTEIEARANLNMGLVYYMQGKPEMTIQYWEISLDLYKKLEKQSNIAQLMGDIAVVHKREGNFSKAIEYFQGAIKIFDKIGETLRVARYTYNLGNMYFNYNDLDKALTYYTEAIPKFEEVGDSIGMGYVYNSIGLVYQQQENKKLAIENYLMALKIFEAQNNPYLVANTQMHLGLLYAQQGNYEDALKFSEKSLEFIQQSANKQDLPSAIKNLADVHKEMKNYDEALKYYIQSIEIAEDMNLRREIVDMYKEVSEIYKAKADFKNSLDYYTKYSSLKDTIFTEDNQKLITEMETKYETEKKEKEIELLNVDKALQDAQLKQQKIFILSIIGLAVFILMLLVLAYNRYLIKKKANHDLAERNAEISQQKEEIEAQRDEIQKQRDIVVKQKQEIEDSIHYARRIQSAVIPPDEALNEALPNHFILWKPRDIVSGDFYWMTTKNGKTVVAAADCTGHGVPGAFMSMLGISFLNEIANKPEIESANQILDLLREYVIKSLRQTGKEQEQKDGMDIALCVIDYNTNKLEFAGAYNPLYIIREGELLEYKANKMPIGIYFRGLKPFTSHEIELKDDDVLYIFSDGFPDQFGGPKGRKFMSKNFKKLLLDNHQKPLEEQKAILNTTIEEWRGHIEQVDDMLVIGIKI